MNEPTSDESTPWEESTNPTIPTTTGVSDDRPRFPVLPWILGALAIGAVIGLATAVTKTPPSRRKKYEKSVRKAGKAVRKAIEPRRKEFFDQIERVRASAESALGDLPRLPSSRKSCAAVEQAVAKLQALAPWN